MRYKSMKVPVDVWEAFYKKKQSIQDILKNDLKKNAKFHFTDVMRFFSQRPTIVFPHEIEGYLSNKKRRKSLYPISI